ncbi:endolytic transglycosylase MltG [Jeotgalibacillus salarius]|uniref:Endolytic transglycosylase MltG n=1 Tax=Jeotgalibacillus salarius TaxID=546023 RepID=A0A4Y8L5S5_9BACL|nr:endolytic transglycosylase MltG [Jeotgalibacillus salarius]TFD97514.1 hypothetical protein E2626_16410 [Jeotgalibacillus salarius]
MLDRRSIRSTGIGMMASALLIFSAGYFMSEKPPETVSNVSENEMIISKDEYNGLQDEISQWEQRVQLLEEEAPEESPVEVTRIILSVEAGMTSPEIGDQLFSGGIIDDEDVFNEYLVDQNLTDRIQIGEYDLNSTMSIEQIAKLITQ